jgi:hypothetical protein
VSLISEALKKARQEAARQDAARQGVPYAVGSTEPKAERNTFVMLLAGLGAGCLLAVALFATAFFAGWGPFEKSPAAPAPQVAQASPSATTVPVPAVPSSSAPAEIQEEEPTGPVQAIPPPAPAPEPQPAAPPPSIEIRPTVPAPRPEPVPAEPAPAPQEERPAEAAPVPAPPPTPASPAGGLVEGQTYTGEVPVPGGGALRLNGIAFSQERPVVVLDGRVMGTGEVVQGFTVVEIEAGRVKLQGHGATVYVSPK